jgi:hypothetical protein
MVVVRYFLNSFSSPKSATTTKRSNRSPRMYDEHRHTFPHRTGLFASLARDCHSYLIFLVHITLCRYSTYSKGFCFFFLTECFQIHAPYRQRCNDLYPCMCEQAPPVSMNSCLQCTLDASASFSSIISPTFQNITQAVMSRELLSLRATSEGSRLLNFFWDRI